jgi:tetratricopeptide (TPR) repeat protein
MVKGNTRRTAPGKVRAVNCYSSMPTWAIEQGEAMHSVATLWIRGRNPVRLTVCSLLACLAVAGCAAQGAKESSTSGAAPAKNALPRDPNTLVLGAEMALQRKQYLLATEALSAAAAAGTDEQLAERATKVAFEHHQNSFVLQNAKHWLEINSTSEEARRFAGVAALRLYRIEEAAANFEALLRTAYISPQAGFIALLPQLMEEGSRPAAMGVLKILVEKFPNAAESHYSLAQAAMAADNHALALSSATRATELSPYWMTGKAMLARVQSATGQHDAALATMRAVLEQEDKAERRLEYAHLLYVAGKVDDARNELEKLTSDPEASAGAQRSLALFDMDTGQFEAASKRYRDLVTSGRFVYEGIFRLGQISEKRNSLDDAFELYSRVLDGDYALAAQGRAARLKAKSSSVEEGLKVLKNFAAEHDELAIETVAAESSYLADMGDNAGALKVLKDALVDYPEHDGLRYAHALLLERMGRISESIAVMRALVKDRPNDPAALNMLGYTLVDRGRKHKEGFELIRTALDVIPDNAAVLDSMGWALFKMNKHEEALPYLEKALQHGHDPEIALHVGDVQWALNRQSDARATWESALKESPDHAVLKSRVEKRRVK